MDLDNQYMTQEIQDLMSLMLSPCCGEPKALMLQSQCCVSQWNGKDKPTGRRRLQGVVRDLTEPQAARSRKLDAPSSRAQRPLSPPEVSIPHPQAPQQAAEGTGNTIPAHHGEAKNKSQVRGKEKRTLIPCTGVGTTDPPAPSPAHLERKTPGGETRASSRRDGLCQGLSPTQGDAPPRGRPPGGSGSQEAMRA